MKECPQGGDYRHRTKRNLDRIADLTARNPAAVDVIDHVLDKGIVIECMVNRVSLSGIHLPVTVKAGFIVASLDTYLERPAQEIRLPAGNQCVASGHDHPIVSPILGPDHLSSTARRGVKCR
jgi:hypothetical protein